LIDTLRALMNAFMLMQKARAFSGVAAKLCSLSLSACILKTILVLIQRNGCPKDVILAV